MNKETYTWSFAKDDWRIFQAQYDAIYSFFRTTTEPYDDLDWDGRELLVWLGLEVIERYSLEDLRKLIPHLAS